jgi:hypothetical protein
VRRVREAKRLAGHAEHDQGDGEREREVVHALEGATVRGHFAIDYRATPRSGDSGGDRGAGPRLPASLSAWNRQRCGAGPCVRANVRSGSAAGTIASGVQVNSAQLRSPEQAEYRSVRLDFSGCGPGGRGFESRRSPSSALQIAIFRETVDRRGVNGGDNFRACGPIRGPQSRTRPRCRAKSRRWPPGSVGPYPGGRRTEHGCVICGVAGLLGRRYITLGAHATASSWALELPCFQAEQRGGFTQSGKQRRPASRRRCSARRPCRIAVAFRRKQQAAPCDRSMVTPGVKSNGPLARRLPQCRG